jgi:hypothetical protein
VSKWARIHCRSRETDARRSPKAPSYARRRRWYELEEIDDEDFDHKHYVTIILNSHSFKDTNGRTLRDVIENDADGCWGLPLQSVMAVFEVPGPQSAPFDGVLHDVLAAKLR